MNQKSVAVCHRQVLEMVTHAKSRLNSIKMNKLKRHFKQISPLIIEEHQQSNKQNYMDNQKTNTNGSQKHESLTQRSFILQPNNLSELLNADLNINQFMGQEDNDQNINRDQKSHMTEQSFISQRTYKEDRTFIKQYEVINNKHKLCLVKIHRLQQENSVLQREVQTLKNKAQKQLLEKQDICKTQQIGVNTEFAQSISEDKLQNNQLLNRLMELQDQNSRQLQKIIELTSNTNNLQKKEMKTQTYFQIETNQSFGQTELNLSDITLLQIQNKQHQYVLQTIEAACAQISNQPNFTLTQISNFNTWLQQVMNRNMKNHLLPLQCQVKLLNQIIQSNKKSFQQKQRQKSQLLTSAYQTIQHLLQQIKETQVMAKINYKGLLDFERKSKSLRPAEQRS